MSGFLREEGGFTLAEMLVTMVLMLTVMFALYSIFDMGIRVFSFGNDKIEAVENARTGLDKMAREIRAAYPYDQLNSKKHLFWNPASPSTGAFPASSNSITFGNDLDGNRKIDAASEQITYDMSGGSPATLRRNGQSAVEYVQDADGDGKALTFQYLKSDGITSAASEADIAIVHIKLEVAVDRGIQEKPVTQVLETDVKLRNRS